MHARLALAFGLLLVGCTASNPNYAGSGADLSSQSQGNDLSGTGGGDLAGGAPDLLGVTQDLTGGTVVDLTSPGDFGNCPEGKACAASPTVAGLCRSGECKPCNDPADDGACTVAYGGNRLCLFGSCAPGDCRTSAGCAGKLCLGTLCIGCTSSAQCQADPEYGASTICDTTTGQCVGTTCTVTATQPTLGCAGAADHVCCSGTLSNGSQGTCQDGNCCQSTDCPDGQKCIKPSNSTNKATAGVCSSCPAAIDNTYFVDPVDGDDGAGTGATTAGCAFRTLSHALAMLPSPAALNTTLVVRGQTFETPLDASEIYPIAVPSNVSITIQAGSGDIRVDPAAKVFFILAGKNIHFGGTATERFLLDGSNAPAGERSGISTTTGADVFVHDVSIRKFEGLQGTGLQVVAGATVTTQQEVEISDCGTGIRVAGRTVSNAAALGHLIANYPDPLADLGLSVHDNEVGLSVTGLGWVSLFGGNAFDERIRFVNNATAGIAINQFASPNLKANSIDGVYVAGDSKSGLSVTFDSRLKLRRSIFAACEIGALVTTTLSSAIAPDPAGIDFGTGGDFGENTFQDGTAPNTTSGVCVFSAVNPSAPLHTRGNYWNDLDCTMGGAGQLVTDDKGACTGGVDVGMNGLASALGVDLTKVYEVQSCSL